MLVHPDRQQLTQMLTLLRQGEVQVTVSGEYTLAEGALAHQAIEQAMCAASCCCACPPQTASPDEWHHRMGLGWLFLSAFTSATLLPGSSEVLLGAMATKGEWSMASLLFWATLGNTLGSMTTWWLGWLATFKKKPEDFQGRGEQKALGWLKQHGHWCLLLAWTPVVGDGLCLLAGWLRLSFWRSLILIGLGKLFVMPWCFCWPVRSSSPLSLTRYP
jgi:membrane protein YqaA with SNARE-associated domain